MTWDKIHNINTIGSELEKLNISLPEPGLLKGYEYTEFKPTSTNPIIDQFICPSQSDALSALEDLKKILHPQRNNGIGHKDPNMDLWCCACIEGMFSMLNLFTNPQSISYNQWGSSACQASIGMGQGKHCACWLCDLNYVFLAI
jgi:hypothetical protein